MKLRSILVGLVVGILIGGSSLYAKEPGPEIEINGNDVVDKDIQPQPSGIPRIISFQGVLKDSSGNPQNGEFEMTFKLYDAETGGNQIWTETKNVTVKDGLYNTLLGEVESLAGVVFDKSYWLEVEVGGSVLKPRYRLASSPYALNALGQGECLWTQGSGNNIYREDGNVGIGTKYPQKMLHIVNPAGGYDGLGICLDPHGGSFVGGTSWDIDNDAGYF
jgi:hypothetical protein